MRLTSATQRDSFAQTLFNLLSEMPNCGRWFPPLEEFGSTTDVQPYAVRPGSRRYHHGHPTSPARIGGAPSEVSNGLGPQWAKWWSGIMRTERRCAKLIYLPSTHAEPVGITT